MASSSSPPPPPSTATSEDTSGPLLLRLSKAHHQITLLPSITGAPGIAYGIIHNGALSTNSCGYRDVENALPPDSSTKFLIGSISKTFLSAVLNIGVAEGKIELEEPLSKYLPEFNPSPNPKIDKGTDTSPDLRVASATIRQLLSHTSGLGNPQILINGPRDSALVNEDHCVALANCIPTSNKTGERWGKWTYSNLGYGLLGLALQNVYKGRYADLVRWKIVTPLGLGRTALGRNDVCEWSGRWEDGGHVDGDAAWNRDKDGRRVQSEDIFCMRQCAGSCDKGQKGSNDDDDDASCNIAFPYARLQDGTHRRLVSDNTTDDNRSKFLAPMGMRSSISDLLTWGPAMISPSPPPPISTMANLLQEDLTWDHERPQQWFYQMGWVRTQMPTDKLGVLSYNCASPASRPTLNFQRSNPGEPSPTPTQTLQTNGVMNGSTAAMYAFPQTQTVIVACANAATDGDAADWTVKILAQALLSTADTDTKTDACTDFIHLAEREAEARRGLYARMLHEWESGRETNPSTISPRAVRLQDYIGVYVGMGTTLSISAVSAGNDNEAVAVGADTNREDDESAYSASSRTTATSTRTSTSTLNAKSNSESFDVEPKL
ncbi:beta-lactamase/transpeptidase-like protein [Cadophora sp. DSE1049]|nr:beta-lactamase/transpeptidase-like protein [Cadophora sp. DSE1049]